MSKSTATTKFLLIGQIAERTGLSAKALRLYEKRGLLQPDARSASGYRLYGAKALARLAEISVLKRVGFSLAEIGKLLQRHGSASTLIKTRIATLRQELQSKTDALQALETAWQGLASTSNTIDQLVENIQMNEHLDMQLSDAEMAEFKRRAEIFGKYFSDTEKSQMAHIAEDLGADGVRVSQLAWAQLIKDVRAAMDADTPPTDPAVLDLGHRWYDLVQTVTGGNAELGLKIREIYAKEPQVMATQGMDNAMFDYIRKAMQAAGLNLSRFD
ncbi:MAG: MerR family transcriptional regulator [Xanthomonadales bacterium]|nr:MerR family transcriptional regulator [Xanthomonadales bacterium]